MQSILFTFLLTLSQALFALTLNQTAITHCQNKTIALQRLNCYDALFNAPIHPVAIPKLPAPRKITIIDHIYTQEQQRTSEDEPLLLNSQLEHAASGQQQVIMTTPAIGAIGVRPILAISCHRNITQLHIVLAKPLNIPMINLTLLDQAGKTRIQAPWRTSEAGRSIVTGRGMDSIHNIRALRGAQYIQIKSNQPLLDGLRFDLTGFAKKLPILATACHWNPRAVVKP